MVPGEELSVAGCRLSSCRLWGAGCGAGRAGRDSWVMASGMTVGGAPGFARSVSEEAGKSSALQLAQWRERRK